MTSRIFSLEEKSTLMTVFLNSLRKPKKLGYIHSVPTHTISITMNGVS